MVIGHTGAFDFLEKIEIFYFVRVRARYKLSLVFRLSPLCSKFKFMLSVGIQLFGLKTTSHGKPDLKNSFLRSDLRCGDILGEVQGEVGVQGHPVFQHLPVLCGYSTSGHEHHLTWQTWPKFFPDLTLNLTEFQM